METIIAEKMGVFYDFRIPWDEAIERKFYARMAAFPNSDPEATLDSIAKPYMEQAFDDPVQSMAQWLRQKHNGNPITKRAISMELGKENFDLLRNAGVIKNIRDNFWEVLVNG